MDLASTDASERSGLAIAADVVIAPKAAFEALRVKGRWLVALLATWILGGIGAVLQTPANQHIMATVFAAQAKTDPNMATLSPEKLHSMVAVGQMVQSFTWVYYPVIVLVASVVAAIFFLIASITGKGDGRFPNLFALAVNVAIVQFGLGYLVYGILAVLRGPDAFSTSAELVAAMPSLGMFAAAAGPKVVMFLASATNPFSLWSTWLMGLGLSVVANLRPAIAYGWAIAITVGAGLLATLGAK